MDEATVATKVCIGCRQSLPHDKEHFPTVALPNGGVKYRPRCKPCHSERQHKYHEEHKEEVAVRMKAWRAAHPQNTPEHHAKQAAHRKAHANDYMDVGGRKIRSNTFYSWKHALRKLGITPQDYLDMYQAQGGRCAICGTDKPKKNGEIVAWSVDHDHTTGRVRGLLCHGCNLALGGFKDSTHLLMKAVGYLQSQPTLQERDEDTGTGDACTGDRVGSPSDAETPGLLRPEV